ncbi:hypothetical protein [Almyronema epifaneia]|uniref:Uncharacterized protein n=1 Tax=Almyronema epifaneia S1 TaxID=2991925 RepID=A0ABW6IFF9_9CYAN
MRSSAIALLGFAALTACRQGEEARWTWETDTSSDRYSDLTFGHDLLKLKTASTIAPPEVDLAVGSTGSGLTPPLLKLPAIAAGSAPSPQLALTSSALNNLPPIPIRPDLSPPVLAPAPASRVSVAPAQPIPATLTATPQPSALLPALPSLLTATPPRPALPIEPAPAETAPQFAATRRATTVAAVVDTVLAAAAADTTAANVSPLAVPPVTAPLPPQAAEQGELPTAAASLNPQPAELAANISGDRLDHPAAEAIEPTASKLSRPDRKPLQLSYSENLRLASPILEQTSHPCIASIPNPNAEAAELSTPAACAAATVVAQTLAAEPEGSANRESFAE